jgi:hypothetical protein
LYQPGGAWIKGPKWPLRSENPNTFPIDDVMVEVRQLPTAQDSKKQIEEKQRNVQRIKIGTVRPDGDFTDVSLQPGSYQLDIHTRYERFIQRLVVRPDPKHSAGWRTDYDVRRFPKGELLRKCCEN